MECECGAPAVYLRRNEGRHYCSRCLARQVEKNFLKTIRKDNLVQKNDVIAVGVSGGKDSMVLLHLMKKLSRKVPIKLIALTIDEGIHGYRDRSIDIVKDFTEHHGIEHHVFSFEKEIDFKIDDLGKAEKHCTYCGVFRRYLLNKKSRELGAHKLAVGHNLDDEAQSVLMNVMRGDTARMKRLGEQGEKENFVPRIKPLKNVPEKEIVAYALIKKIPYFDGECPNSFNNHRRDVQSLVNEMENKYPGTKNNIIRFYSKIRDKIPSEEGAISRCIKCGEPASQAICKACELQEKAKDMAKSQ
jgi:uncharacterized protein (TIGR00269 family)